MKSSNHKYFIKAQQIANRSDYQKTHVGCIAVYQNKIIGSGCNCNKTHPIQKFYNQYRMSSDSLLSKIHAEINCINSIKSLNINFSKVKLYIYRIRQVQPFGLSRPCPSCMAAIKRLELKIFFIQLMMDLFTKGQRKITQEVL